MYILIYSIKRCASFFTMLKNRVILWCLLLYADARGPVEVFVAFLIWTPHFFIHIYVFVFPLWFPIYFLSKLHSSRSLTPSISRDINHFSIKCMFTYDNMIRL